MGLVQLHYRLKGHRVALISVCGDMHSEFQTANSQAFGTQPTGKGETAGLVWKASPRIALVHRALTWVP